MIHFAILASAFALGVDEPTGPISVAPTAIEIRHHRHSHPLQVTASATDGISIDLHGQATFVSADPKIATVDASGAIRPAASGKTEIVVRVAGQTKSIPVVVRLPAVEPPVSFRHEVMAVLSKTGCNMGACHGYSLGKNGFKLSLRGAEPEQDYFAITRDAFGRRVISSVP